MRQSTCYKRAWTYDQNTREHCSYLKPGCLRSHRFLVGFSKKLKEAAVRGYARQSLYASPATDET